MSLQFSSVLLLSYDLIYLSSSFQYFACIWLSRNYAGMYGVWMNSGRLDAIKTDARFFVIAMFFANISCHYCKYLILREE